jgi:allene oxide cyclase
MMKRLMVLGSVVLLLVAWGGISLASSRTSARGVSKVQNFRLISVNAHFKTGDTGRQGPSAGDTLVFHAVVKDADESEKLGRQDGSCIFTQIEKGEDRFEVCTLNFVLADGEITLEGTFDQLADTNTFAVIGGTGIYTSAQGQVVADFSEKFQFDFELLP